uniref:DUF4216 domain-containing protein n=1 Tax=Tanacetum cinerariifolium TaxID=118510 RepID=A0A6L2P6M1_TANCI|nr:hypothetical protein [Tanacetum cinerariifolium]
MIVNPCRTPVDIESKLGSDGDPTLYRSLAGALEYLTFTRPNLSYVVQQRHVTLSRSSAEAEHRGVANVVVETVRIRNFSPSAYETYRDRYTFFRDYVASRQVLVLHVPSRFQYADIFTNGLPSALFLEFRSSLNVQRPSVLTSKAGKRFAFVRFIKVNNLDRLVENLCTIWIGRYHPSANSVRFERPHKSFTTPYAKPGVHSRPSNPYAFQHSNGRVGSYVNAINDACNDFVSEERIVWVDIEGVPLNAWSQETFVRIGKMYVCLGKWLDVENAHGEILRHGFLPGYTEWIVHGEHNISLPPSQSTNVNVEETFFGQDDIRGLVRDAFGINSLPSVHGEHTISLPPSQSTNVNVEETFFGQDDIRDTEEFTENGDHSDEGVSYKRLLEECDKELYAGCNMIQELLSDAFPHLMALPSSAYEAKQFTKDLGLGYEKIHACPNDCMLYWDDRAGQQSCHICKASRYKSDELGGSSKARKSNKPAKVLCYFPLIPRLKSTWPVLLIPYNLPPWICMKRQSFILSSIIPGEKAPGNDIDAGAPRVAWHVWFVRTPPTQENRGSPTPLTGSDVLKQLSGIRFKYGKSKKRTREEDVGSTSTHAKEATHDEGAFECTNTIIEEDIDGENLLWKKKSVFFDLEYWEHNLLRHNLDVMHIEKNVSDNIIGTLLGLDGKDNKNTRKDLKEMGIRHDLHLINRPNEKPYLPPACYTMSPVEKSNFLQLLKDLKVPDGYSSNILRGVSVKDHKISNLKSHDGHILMQDVLLIALRESVISRTQSRLVKAVSLLQEENVDEEVLSLAIGPNIAAKQYKGFITNSYRFLIRRHEEFKKTQNSGVMVEVEGGYYYGKLTNIIELEYFRGYKIVLFQCDWVDNRLYRGLKKDKYGFPLVNFSRPLVHTVSKMFKSKTTMQNHKRKQSEMNPPTSHNFQTQSKSFFIDMQTTRQVIKNTNHPSSALKASFGPSSHMQTTRQVINNTNHLSSSFQLAIRPSFLYDMCQNSSSSSSLQASVGPDVHQNSSSSSSSSRSQSLQSQLAIHEPTLHQSSSLNSVLNQDHDLLSEVEINLADQYEQNLLSKVEIIDMNGNILRTQKMTAKQVYKLKGGEKVLVHVNKDYQLIKNADGLCSRFMTLILKQPNLCLPDAKDWKECKESCAAMLIAELRRRLCIPQGERVDKVLSAMFSVKRRTVKYRLKQGLYQQAANKLNVANGINGLDA